MVDVERLGASFDCPEEGEGVHIGEAVEVEVNCRGVIVRNNRVSESGAAQASQVYFADVVIY